MQVIRIFKTVLVQLNGFWNWDIQRFVNFIQVFLVELARFQELVENDNFLGDILEYQLFSLWQQKCAITYFTALKFSASLAACIWMMDWFMFVISQINFYFWPKIKWNTTNLFFHSLLVLQNLKSNYFLLVKRNKYRLIKFTALWEIL